MISGRRKIGENGRMRRDGERHKGLEGDWRKGRYKFGAKKREIGRKKGRVEKERKDCVEGREGELLEKVE